MKKQNPKRYIIIYNEYAYFFPPDGKNCHSFFPIPKKARHRQVPKRLLRLQPTWLRCAQLQEIRLERNAGDIHAVATPARFSCFLFFQMGLSASNSIFFPVPGLHAMEEDIYHETIDR